MLSEKVVLIARDAYSTIPNELNVNAVPTATELEYVGAEDFDKAMVNDVLPKVVDDSEGMDFSELYDFDYDWLCRCLRLKSYGPYFTTNRIFCPDCNDVHRGEYQVDLRSVPITPMPKGFVNDLTVDAEEFIDCKDRISFKLLTVKDKMHIDQDTMFDRSDGTKNLSLARLCYQIKSIGNQKDMTPLDVRQYITKKMSAADYEILKDCVAKLTNFGMHVMGYTACPVCGSKNAYYIALQQDKFFRPSVGDIKQYKSAIRSGDWKKLPGNPSEYVRKHS